MEERTIWKENKNGKNFAFQIKKNQFVNDEFHNVINSERLQVESLQRSAGILAQHRYSDTTEL